MACTCPSIHFSLDEDILKITVGWCVCVLTYMCVVVGVLCVNVARAVCGLCVYLWCCVWCWWCVCCCGGACVWCCGDAWHSLSLSCSLSFLFSLIFLFLFFFFFSLLFLFPLLLLLLLLFLLLFLFLLPRSSFLLPPSSFQRTKKKRGNKSAFEDVWSPWFVVKTMAVDVFDTLTFVLDQ